MTLGTLFIVATPIGNLDDFCPRAVRTLQKVDMIFCEDTRVTEKLCQAYGINTLKKSCNHHNEAGREPELIQRLAKGESIAYVSDAGTPGVSDPGARLVRAARDNGFKVVPIPGASAMTAALSISGLQETTFIFLGFLPSKASQRQKILQAQNREMAFVFYESPHRVKETVFDLINALDPVDEVFIFRELTKKFEDCWCGTVQDLSDYAQSMVGKGEFVIIVSPKKGRDKKNILTQKQIHLLSQLLGSMSVKDATRLVVEHESLPKKMVYEKAIDLKNKMNSD